MGARTSKITFEMDALRLLTRIFTRPMFSSLVDKKSTLSAFKFLLKNEVVSKNVEQPLGEFFDNAWSTLRKMYRTEYVYKAELANRIIFGRHRPTTAALHVEMPVRRSVVDLAIINGTSTAYEIKTEFDSPRRLLSQTGDYLNVFDKVFVVTHPDCATAYQRLVASSVGILSLNLNGSISVVRDAISNKENISSRAVFKCLRRSEYVTAIEEHIGEKIDYPKGLIEGRCEELFSAFTPLKAHDIFVNATRSRTTNLETVSFVSQLPKSLRVLGYSTPLSERQRLKILETLSLPMNLTLSF